MGETNRININSLKKEAKSKHNEAFQVLARMQNCRVGVGARLESAETPSFFVEVLVNLCTSDRSVNLELVEMNLLLLKQLEKRGYVLNCEEDGSISCELTVSSKNLIAECTAILDIVSRE
ncbi:MAG: hypothetical protein ACFFCW_35600 [Candidatus Hodarchaeota archaeon]